MSALVHHARRRAAPMPSEPRLRARVEAAIESLVALLDTIDGDPDLEDGDDAEAVNESGDPLDRGELDEAELSQQWHERSAGYAA